MRWRDELTRRFPKLTRLGSDTYVVGGAIRDLLLGREPNDVDLACLDPLAAAKKIPPTTKALPRIRFGLNPIKLQPSGEFPNASHIRGPFPNHSITSATIAPPSRIQPP